MVDKSKISIIFPVLSEHLENKLGKVDGCYFSAYDNTKPIVKWEGHLVCGACRNCLAGKRHLCKDTKGVGVNRDGAFAEYLAIPATNVWRCSPDIEDDILSCFDPLPSSLRRVMPELN